MASNTLKKAAKAASTAPKRAGAKRTKKPKPVVVKTLAGLHGALKASTALSTTMAWLSPVLYDYDGLAY